MYEKLFQWSAGGRAGGAFIGASVRKWDILGRLRTIARHWQHGIHGVGRSRCPRVPGVRAALGRGGGEGRWPRPPGRVAWRCRGPRSCGCRRRTAWPPCRDGPGLFPSVPACPGCPTLGALCVRGEGTTRGMQAVGCFLCGPSLGGAGIACAFALPQGKASMETIRAARKSVPGLRRQSCIRPLGETGMTRQGLSRPPFPGCQVMGFNRPRPCLPRSRPSRRRCSSFASWPPCCRSSMSGSCS